MVFKWDDAFTLLYHPLQFRDVYFTRFHKKMGQQFQNIRGHLSKFLHPTPEHRVTMDHFEEEISRFLHTMMDFKNKPELQAS